MYFGEKIEGSRSTTRDNGKSGFLNRINNGILVEVFSIFEERGERNGL
jgi:hypothetical protein